MNMEMTIKDLLNRAAETAAYNSKLAGELGNLLIGPQPPAEGNSAGPAPTPEGLILVTIDSLMWLLSELEHTRALLLRLNDNLFSKSPNR